MMINSVRQGGYTVYTDVEYRDDGPELVPPTAQGSRCCQVRPP